MYSLRDDRVLVPRLNALKFLQWGCKKGGRDGRAYARQRSARREALGALLLTVVIIHHKPSTLCIEIVTNRNLGVITDNFYEFW
jgi:hypothetical protein